MADIELLIKISEDTFFDLKKKQNRTEVDNAVLNGTPQKPKVAPIAEIKFDKDELKELVNEAVLRIRPKGHWINKQHLFNYCSAECSSCHERSNGYVHDNGFSLEHKYYDFCPNCGSDNREEDKNEHG